jgi:hypothetical protein
MADASRSGDESDLSAVAEHIHERLERGEDPDARALAAEFARGEDEIAELIAAAKRLRDFETRSPGRRQHRPAPAPGERLGGFVIESVLGRGGMATVFRARQPALGDRAVALKVIREPPGSALRQRLEDEAVQASRLHHPHIAELYDFGAEGGLAFYAMRLVEGPTLQEVLQRLSEAQALRHDPHVRRRIVRWVSEVAEALEYAHARGLVHRDVKPSNVMLARAATAGEALADCPAILVDFGLVYSRGRDAGMEALAYGTREYASPEQHEGRSPDARSDVFSLGATLHDLLTATLPQQRGSSAAGLPPIDVHASGIDADLAAIAGMATDVDAEWRYASAAAFRRDLEAWLAGDPVVARRWSWPRRALWLARRHPLRLARGAALAFALACAGFCGAKLFEWRRSALRAREAREAARPRELVDALASIPALGAGLVLRDPTFGELRRRVADDSVEDPIERLAALERDDDVRGALTTAATELARDGLATRPFELAYLCSALDVGASEERQTQAIVLAARLMYERPDRSVADETASAPLRIVLRTRLRAAGAGDRDAHLLSFTALSGCGVEQDVDMLVGRALEAPEPDETMRLALVCAERIVRRLNARKTPVSARTLPWWPRYCALARRVLDEKVARPGSVPGDLAAAFEALSVASLLSERARGGSPSVDDLVGGDWIAAVASGDISDRLRPVAELLAAAGDARVGRGLSGVIRREAHAPQVSHWGRCCGLLKDIEVTDACRLAASEIESRVPGSVAMFEEGLALAVGELAGAKPDYELDEESTLIHACTDAAFDEPPVAVGDLPTEEAIAAWDFEQPTIALSGSASRVRIASVRHGPTDNPKSVALVMADFGRAAVRMEFEIRSAAPSAATLILYHQPAARAYYPHRGTAFVEVSIDGELLTPGIAVADFTHREDRVRIPTSRLAPGPHAITIRLSERSNTTYRLHRAWIE